MASEPSNPVLRPAARLAGVRAYAPPRPRWAIDLRLDANEGAGPSPKVLEAIAQAGSERARRYPDARGLEAAIAGAWGIDPARVVVTNGGDDAIDRVCRAVLEPGRELVVHEPTFEMIARSARLAGGSVRGVAWAEGAFPVSAVLDAIGPGTGLVALVSPNNPTGGEIPEEDVLRVVDAAAGVGALALVDLAYVEFAERDPTAALLERPNVVVVRTFSKAMGLAGLRVGYALASVEVAGWLRAAGGPYPVAGVALAGAEAAWQRRGEGASVARVRSERERFTALAERLGLGPMASGANFVTLRTPRTLWVRDALGSLGIGVRAFDGRAGLEDLCRVTMPGEERGLARLLGALEVASSPEAVLFDLDGVLADVSGSYRAAIVETARSYGVEVDGGDVARAKRAGDANNDWVLTRRLLAARGVEASLEAVTARFQRVYLGEGGAAGLRERESLIGSAAALRALAGRVRLGVVTGRPRVEAAWFLERAGLGEVFEVVVAMEDGPAKPSPAPVLTAMERMGIGRAWMVGDTPDDARAARAAGVVPIGVVAPGEDREASAAALEAAGVARVLGSWEQLMEVLG